MTDFNTIRVISFCENGYQLPIWSEMFLEKAKRYGFKSSLLEKLSILKEDDKFDEVSIIGKKMTRTRIPTQNSSS
jgi:hypothetical protein